MLRRCCSKLILFREIIAVYSKKQRNINNVGEMRSICMLHKATSLSLYYKELMFCFYLYDNLCLRFVIHQLGINGFFA